MRVSDWHVGSDLLPHTQARMSDLLCFSRYDSDTRNSILWSWGHSGRYKMSYKSDIEIARGASKALIQDIGAKIGIESKDLLPYGHDKAKVSQSFINSVQGRENGKLILVTAINPTPAGEGKTTTTVGLGDGLNRIGKNAMVCIREASLGPNFGMKGGAAGGGYAQIVPMEDMNLHFTGDFHAITSAHSLLSAMIDNHIYWAVSYTHLTLPTNLRV